MLTNQNPFFTSQSSTYPLYPTDIPPSSTISTIRKTSLIENFRESLGNDPRTAPSWNILTNLASHDLSAMRELLGSPNGVEYAARDGMSDDGRGVGWWNVVFDYGGFKAHYEVCQVFVPFDADMRCVTLLMSYEHLY